MKVIDIYQEGAIAKYEIAVSRQDFDVHFDNLNIVLSWGMNGESVTVTREELYFEDKPKGKCFFMFDTTGMVGYVKATCNYFTPDSDVEETELRHDVDRQMLCFVSSTANTALRPCRRKEHEVRFVHYTPVYESNAKGMYELLRTADGELVRTEDMKIVRVRKEQF